MTIDASDLSDLDSISWDPAKGLSAEPSIDQELVRKIELLAISNDFFGARLKGGLFINKEEINPFEFERGCFKQNNENIWNEQNEFAVSSSLNPLSSYTSNAQDWFSFSNCDSISYRGLWNGRVIAWNAVINRNLIIGAGGVFVGGSFYSYDVIKRITTSPTSPITSGWVNEILQYIGRGVIHEHSEEFEIPFPDPGGVRIDTIGERNAHLRIGGVNGMRTSWGEALSHANYIGGLAPGKSIEWTYNRSHTLLVDAAEIMNLNYQGYSPTNANALLENWMTFHKENESHPHAKYLQICHSQGALHVRNALLQAPPEVRNRIIVIAIAPAGIVPREYCYRSFNYAVEGDWIPTYESAHVARLYNMGHVTEREYKTVLERQKQLIILPKHPDAKGGVHDFQGLSFNKKLYEHIKDYLDLKGKYK